MMPETSLPFDAILFDLDGTLIDTESLAVASGLAALAQNGFQVAADFMHQLIGKDHTATAAIIRAQLPDLDLAEFDLQWRRLFNEGVNRGLPLKPGAEALLEQLAHLPRGLVTSSRREEAHRKLAVAGIARYFDLVISFDDVTAAKPAPDPYLLAAERLGVQPDRCLVFEDSETGAEAAHRAGCRVVQVPDVLPSDGKWAHHLANDLLEGARAAGLI
jgi:HAD superfamily hydrolase (TIGR01509 family)